MTNEYQQAEVTNSPSLIVTYDVMQVTSTNAIPIILQPTPVERTPDQQIAYQTMVGTWGTVVVALLAAIVASIQAWLIRKQIKEAQVTNAVALRALEHSQEVATQSIQLSKEAMKQSEKSITVSVEASRLDNRCWLTLDLVGVRFHSTEDAANATLQFHLKNVGKTPIKSGLLLVGAVTDPAFDWDSAIKTLEKGEAAAAVVMGPIIVETMLDIDFPLPPAQVLKINKGEEQMGVLARVEYTDIFDQSHSLKHAWYVDPKKGIPAFYSGYAHAS